MDRRPPHVHARVFGIAENRDCSACAAATQLLVFHYSPTNRKIVFTTKHTFTEKPAARGFISAFNHRDKKAALRYATHSVVASWIPGPTGMRFSFAGCYGILSSNFPAYLDPPSEVMRACLGDVSSADGTALFMKRTSWRTWKVSAVAIP